MRYAWVPILAIMGAWAPAGAQTVQTLPVADPPRLIPAARREPQGFLGAMLAQVPPGAARLAGLPPRAGASVEEVVPGGPAAAAGIQAGDILLALDGKPIAGPSQLGAEIRALPPGRRVALSFARHGLKQEATVALGERPEPPAFAAPPAAMGIGIPPTPPPAMKLVTLDVQAAGLGDAILRVLNGSGFAFRVAPELLADAALAARPFGHKATNTPLSQVLDALAARYGIRWKMAGDAVSFETR